MDAEQVKKLVAQFAYLCKERFDDPQFDDTKTKLFAAIDAMQAEIDRLRKDAERLKANVDAMQKAWYAIGADLAGLKWSDFMAAIDAALSEEAKGTT